MVFVRDIFQDMSDKVEEFEEKIQVLIVFLIFVSLSGYVSSKFGRPAAEIIINFEFLVGVFAILVTHPISKLFVGLTSIVDSCSEKLNDDVEKWLSDDDSND